MADAMEQTLSDNGFSRVVETIRGQAFLSLALLILVPAGFLAYSLLIPKIYSAVVTLAPAASERDMGAIGTALDQLGGFAALAGLANRRDSSKDEAVAVLRSRAFTERFLETSGAMNEILNARFGGDVESRYKVYRHFDSKIRSVTEIRRTGLFTIAVYWLDREMAAKWANELVAQLNAEMRARAIADADRNLKFLNDQLAQSDQIVVREAIGRLIEAQVKQRMLASVTEEFAFRIIDPAVPAALQEHDYPKRVLFGLGGVFLAATLVVAIAIFRMRRGARSSSAASTSR